MLRRIERRGRAGGGLTGVWFVGEILTFFVTARSEAWCCFVGAQLEGIIWVSACVLGFDTGADWRAGWSVGRATTVGLWVQLPHRLTRIPA